jgi:hypothetical protein
MRLHAIRLAADDLCPHCGVVDSLPHRLTMCGKGPRQWEWVRFRIALILRTGSQSIPDTWLVQPQFQFWPPQRQRAILWFLATFVDFRTQPRSSLTRCDYHDFFQRTKRKLYSLPKRLHLVGNYIDIVQP